MLLEICARKSKLLESLCAYLFLSGRCRVRKIFNRAISHLQKAENSCHSLARGKGPFRRSKEFLGCTCVCIFVYIISAVGGKTHRTGGSLITARVKCRIHLSIDAIARCPSSQFKGPSILILGCALSVAALCSSHSASPAASTCTESASVIASNLSSLSPLSTRKNVSFHGEYLFYCHFPSHPTHYAILCIVQRDKFHDHQVNAH